MRKIIAHVGNDVHQEFTQAAVYEEDEQKPRIEKQIKTEKSAVQKFYKKLNKKYEIKACYEAGSSGYVFYRWLKEIGYKPNPRLSRRGLDLFLINDSTSLYGMMLLGSS